MTIYREEKTNIVIYLLLFGVGGGQRRGIETEVKAKVVASFWGEEFIQLLISCSASFFD